MTGTGVSQQQHSLPVVFLAFANEPHRYLARLADEARILRESWQAFHDQGRCELVWLPNVTLNEIFATFRRYRDRIVLFHYGGHADSYRLLLEAGGGQTAPLDATAFASFLAGQQGLRLVFLNGCSTRAQVAALQEAGIHAVIATEQDIRDDVAVDFARAFYQGLLSDATLQIAFNQAAAEVRSRINFDGAARHLRTVPDVDPIKAEPPWALHCRPAEVGSWRWSQLALTPSFARKPFEPETVLIPAGPFLMGEGEAQHAVSLAAYRIGKYPVTNAEYAQFLQQNKAHPVPQGLGWFSRRPPEGKENHPVVGVSWHDAMAYCAWLRETSEHAYRLPTEAEWEKAATWEPDSEKTGRKYVYPWGDIWRADGCTVEGNATTPVDAHPNGVSPFGCWDMFGNVQEWTNTLWGSDYPTPLFLPPYDPDDGREDTQPAHLPTVWRIHRGGSYRDTSERIGNSQRGRASVGSTALWRGFRVALSL